MFIKSFILPSAKKDGKSVCVVRLSGRLDALFSEEVEKRLDLLLEEGNNLFIIDFGDVPYIGSSGIRVLLAFYSKLKMRKGCCGLFSFPSSGFKIIQTMQIEKFFNIFPSEKEALDFVTTNS